MMPLFHQRSSKLSRLTTEGTTLFSFSVLFGGPFFYNLLKYQIHHDAVTLIIKHTILVFLIGKMLLFNYPIIKCENTDNEL